MIATFNAEQVLQRTLGNAVTRSLNGFVDLPHGRFVALLHQAVQPNGLRPSGDEESPDPNETAHRVVKEATEDDDS